MYIIAVPLVFNHWSEIMKNNKIMKRKLFKNIISNKTFILVHKNKSVTSIESKNVKVNRKNNITHL